MPAASALSFGVMHVIYGNVPAVVLSALAGWIFSGTYQRTRSLRLVWLEHSLYGIAAFTVGLGPFFGAGIVH